jgi:hypothetical protein
MPYEYSEMSPQERANIANYRREQGYPLHAPPHPFRGSGAYLISAAIKLLHGKTSRLWILEDGLTGKRTVWYKYADTHMRDDTQFHTASNYIQQNPVKPGYVSDPYDWPWSSLLVYYGDQGKDWLEEQFWAI